MILNKSFKSFSLFILLLGVSWTAYAQPSNNICNTAIEITNVSNWCSDESANFSNIGATASGVDNPFCWPDAEEQDVWFSFVAEATTLNVSVNGAVANTPGGTLEDPQLAIYSGFCGATSLTEIECISDAFNNNFVETFVSNLVVGQTYYIRVDARNQNTGTFELCLNNFNEVPDPSSDCPTAVLLCDKSSFTVQNIIGSGNDDNIDPGSCIQTEFASAWYTWTCDQPGSLTFTLTPSNPADDLDFAVFELPGGINDCTNKQMIRCMASGENVGAPLSDWVACTGSTGLASGDPDTDEFPGCANSDNNFVSEVNMVAGRSYALLVNNFSNSGAGFSITWGGTGTFLGPQADFNIQPEIGVTCDEQVTFTDESSFSAGNIISWEWNFGAGANPGTADGQGPHDVIYESFGMKSVVLTIESDGGCIVTEIIDFAVAECCAAFPDLEINLDNTVDPLCPGDASGIIQVSGNGGNPAYQYSLEGGIFTGSADFFGLIPGEYDVTIQDIKGCEDTLSAIINDPPPIFVDAGEDAEVTLGFSTQLNAIATPSNPSIQFTWTPPDGLSCTDCPDPVATAPGTTTYTVSISNSDGCVIEDEVTVFVSDERPVFIPNAFSPNDDGVNDLFTAYGGPAVDQIAVMRVFNRWGALVYENENFPISEESEGWDGRFKGRDLEPGVFAYMIIIDFIDNQSILFEGDISIIK